MKLIQKSLIFCMFLLIFVSSVSAANLSSEIYVYEDGGYNLKDKDFTVNFDDSDDLGDNFYGLDLKYGISIGDYDKIKNVDVELSIDDFDVSCDDKVIYSTSDNYSYDSNIAQDFKIHQYDCSYDTYYIENSRDSLTSDDSDYFYIEVPKSLIKEFDYDLKINYEDEDGNNFDYKKSGTMEITNSNPGDVDLLMSYDTKACEDSNLDTFDYNVKYDIYLFRDFDDCTFFLKTSDYKNTIFSYQFNTDNSNYYAISFNNIISKLNSEDKFITEVQCDSGSSKTYLYQSLDKLPALCNYDNSKIENSKSNNNNNNLDNDSLSNNNLSDNIKNPDTDFIVNSSGNYTNASTNNSSINQNSSKDSIIDSISKFIKDLLLGFRSLF